MIYVKKKKKKKKNSSGALNCHQKIQENHAFVRDIAFAEAKS